MNRALTLFAMLCLQASFAGHAYADWVRVAGDDELDAYLDPSTRATDGAIVSIKVLLDYKEPRQWTDYLVYASVISARDYDCAGARQRVAMSAFHFESMARDEPRFSTPGGASWKALAKQGFERELWMRACAPTGPDER